MSIPAEQVRGWAIETDGSADALAAALELRGAMLTAGLSGEEPRGGGAVRFVLDRWAESPGFVTAVEDGRLTVAGATRRDLLDGAAWVGERIGVLAPAPGRVTAGRPAGVFEDGERVYRPAFAERGFVLGCDGLHGAWRDWLPFASRNGLTTVFFHDTPPSAWDGSGEGGRRGRMFGWWDREGAAVRELAEQLGLRLEFGGHHLSTLLPREAFAEHPEWFPMRGEERDAAHNLCVSSPGALEALREGARRFFARFPGFGVYHLWPDDLREGGWCECDGCGELTASDQALVATNAVAEVLEEVAPGAKLGHLAYHDTLGAPTAVEPRGNVVAVWAPRNRCYAHALDDDRCWRNLIHHRGLGRLATWFGGSERVRVFEYYSDGILFKWMAPPHLEVLPADLGAYRAAGVGAVMNLAVGPRPWVGPNWHAWWFARCAREGGGRTDEALEEFCRANFGEHAAAFSEMYRRVDGACRLLFERGRIEPRAMFDVLDFGDDRPEELAPLSERARAAVEGLAGAAQALPIAVAGAGLEAVEELSATVAAGMHLAERVIAWQAALGGEQGEAAEHLGMAEMHLRALSDWYHAHAGPAWSTLGEAMLHGARWHTNRVRAMV